MRKRYTFVRADTAETVTVSANGRKHAGAQALVGLLHRGEDPGVVKRLIVPVVPVPTRIVVLLTNEERREARTDRELGTPPLPSVFYN